MLSSPVCVPSNSVPLVSPTLALSEAGGHLPACLPLLFCVCLYCPLSVQFRGLEGLGEHSWTQVGPTQGE